MFGNFYELESKFQDNSFDLFSNSNCDRSPYMSFFYPIPSIDEQYNIELINSQNNNLESALFFQKDNNTINTNISTGIKNNDFNKLTVPIKKNPGKKRKDESGYKAHTKYSEDNIIKKIKASFIRYLDKKLNNSLRFASAYKKFYKLTPTIAKNLKKDDNIRLMNMTIREIYEEYPPNDTHSSSAKKNNYDLIQEIYFENVYTKTIEILNTKYIDLLKTLEVKEFICKELENKIKKQDDRIVYMYKLRNLLEHFKEWFTKKHERKCKSKQNENA